MVFGGICGEDGGFFRGGGLLPQLERRSCFLATTFVFYYWEVPHEGGGFLFHGCKGVCFTNSLLICPSFRVVFSYNPSQVFRPSVFLVRFGPVLLFGNVAGVFYHSATRGPSILAKLRFSSHFCFLRLKYRSSHFIHDRFKFGFFEFATLFHHVRVNFHSFHTGSTTGRSVATVTIHCFSGVTSFPRFLCVLGRCCFRSFSSSIYLQALTAATFIVSSVLPSIPGYTPTAI